MAKFTKFGDMHKFNKTLMEDDFNPGKLYIVKHKKKLDGGAELETNFKVNELKKGESTHALAADHKVKVKMSEFGGVDAECKGTQDGKLEFKSEWKGLGKVEGLEGVSVHVDAVVNTGAKKDVCLPKIGVSFANDQIISKNYISATSVPVFESENAWAACSHFMIGEKMVCDRVKKDYKFELALAGHFEKTMQYGSLVKFANKEGKFGGYQCSLFFN
jgi:hypothetical protein